MTSTKQCPLCLGFNIPHDYDEYHQFLHEIKFSIGHLQKARALTKRLPSMIKLVEDNVVDLMTLLDEARNC